MEQKYTCCYGQAFIDHSDKVIVLRSNNKQMNAEHAENIMQEFVDDNREEFSGKKVINTTQYSINRFKADVI